VLTVALKVKAMQYFASAGLRSALPPAYLHFLNFVVATVVGTLTVVLFIALLRFSVGWFTLPRRLRWKPAPRSWQTRSCSPSFSF